MLSSKCWLFCVVFSESWSCIWSSWTLNKHVMMWGRCNSEIFQITSMDYGSTKKELTNWGETKWPQFSGRHFQMHFIGCKCMNFNFKFPFYKQQGGFHLWINCWQLSWFPGINWDMVQWKFYRQSWPNNTARLFCYSYPQTNSWWRCCIDIPWHLQGKTCEDWEVYEFRKSNCISLPRNKLPTCDNYLYTEWNIFIWIQWADQWFIE